jgi:O-antigen ligase
MEVTPIGWVLLVVGPLLMIVRPKWLYIATVFFLPFTATDIVNVGSGLNVSGLQASMFLGALLILRFIADAFRKKGLPILRAGNGSLVWLGLFTAVTALSLIMPIWIDGRVAIPSPYLLDNSSEPLYLSSHNVTGVMYMIYGFLLVYLVATLNQKPSMIRLTIKTFMAGSVFAALWGIVEFICKMSGVEYPAMIFNTGTSPSALGYQEFLTEGVFRVSSVGVEPSIFAQSLLIAIALYLPFIFASPKLFGTWQDRVWFAVMFLVLCLTTSSTAYLGIPLTVLLVFALLCARKIFTPKHVVILSLIFVVTFAAIVLLYASLPIVQQVLDTALFSKSEGGSALERLMTISNSYEMFLQYPVLGIGWASIASHDLIVNILANAGLVGLLTFSIAIYAIFRILYRSIKSRDRSLGVDGLMRMDFALYVAMGITLATSAISGFLNYFSFFWFVLGLAIAVSNEQGFSSGEKNQGFLADRLREPPRKPSISPRPC